MDTASGRRTGRLVTATDDPYADERAHVLGEALARAAEQGWSEALVEIAGAAAGVAPDRLKLVCPEGVRDLLRAYSEQLDDVMVARLAGAGNLRTRDRIREGVAARLDAMTPHAGTACRAAQLLALPSYSPLALELAYKTVDCLWRAAGDASTDFNFYTKRALAAGVYLTTAAVWFRDRTPGKEETARHLDRRIDDIMMIEGAKRTARRIAGVLPSPLRLLGMLRYPDPPADQPLKANQVKDGPPPSG